MREIVVDPYSGRWYTVGDTGAEFVNLPKGSIVFNHVQSEHLLENGYVSGRASALASGTAMVTGGYTPYKPTGKIPGTSASSSSGGSTGSGSSSSSTSNKTNSGTTGGTTSSTKETAEAFDYIEIKINRIQRSITNLKNSFENAFNSFSKRAKDADKAITKTNELIEIQEQARKRYLAEANSVGLDSSLIPLVQSGQIDITKYDEDTQKLITSYKEWYEKALDSSDAIQELKDSLNDLYKSKFDTVVQRWTNKVQNLEHRIERLNNVVARRSSYASEYVTPDNATTASKKNIKDYQSIISTSQSEIKNKAAELVSLRTKLDQLVSDGKIQKGTQSYYEMLASIQEVEREIDDLNQGIIDASNSISEEYMNMFNNVATTYENKLSLAEHLSNFISKEIDKASAEGYMASTKYYDVLIKQEQSNISTLTKEKEKLEKAMYNALASGEIQKGSQAWYDMRNKINEVSESIQDAELSIINFNNSIRDIEWERFDFLQDQISNLTSESDFLIDLLDNSELFNDNGTFNDNGLAVLGLHGQNYNVLMAQADKYAEEIRKIEAELSDGHVDTELINRKQDLISKQREAITSAEQEKQAIKDLVKEGYDLELDSMSDLINSYTDALDAKKSLSDFEKKVKDQTKNIASLQKQLAAYQNDITEETQLKLQKLKVELQEANEDLDETMYERYISDQKELLDTMYNDYEKNLNERLDDTNGLISEVINTVNTNSGNIYETLQNVASDVGVVMSNEMQDIWDTSVAGKLDENTTEITNVLTTYGANFSSALTSINSTISNIATTVGSWVTQSEQNAQDDIDYFEQEEERIEQIEQEALDKAEGQGTKDEAKDATTNKVTQDAKDKAEENKNTNTNKTPTTQTDKKPTTQTNKTGGDGVAKVGDKVKFVSGRYYEDSWGQGKSGYHNLGDNVYILRINPSGTHPYLIGTQKGVFNSGLGWLKLSQLSGYAKGSKYISEDQLGWTNELGSEVILSPTRNAILTDLRKGDKVVNAKSSQNLYDFANNPSGFIGSIYNGTKGNGSSVTNNDIVLNNEMVFPNVKNYGELITEMQHDVKFEKLIQAMTIGQLSGRNQNKKYNYKF